MIRGTYQQYSSVTLLNLLHGPWNAPRELFTIGKDNTSYPRQNIFTTPDTEDFKQNTQRQYTKYKGHIGDM